MFSVQVSVYPLYVIMWSVNKFDFRHRVPYSSGWIASPASRDCLVIMWLALDLMASPASQAYVERLFSLCGDLTARKRNSTKVSLCRRVFLKLNRHMHWTQCTVNWSVTCFWYCRTAEDTLQRLHFLLLLTYLLSVIISRTTLTYKNVKTKTKMILKTKKKHFH